MLSSHTEGSQTDIVKMCWVMKMGFKVNTEWRNFKLTIKPKVGINSLSPILLYYVLNYCLEVEVDAEERFAYRDGDYYYNQATTAWWIAYLPKLGGYSAWKERKCWRGLMFSLLRFWKVLLYSLRSHLIISSWPLLPIRFHVAPLLSVF